MNLEKLKEKLMEVYNMVRKTLEKGGQELTGMYPRFDEIGDYCEGNFLGFEIDDYNNQRILLWKGNDDETGESITQCLPATADLKRYYSQLEKGMWLHIEFVKVIPSNNENYSDKKIFKVEVDDERDVVFEEGEE